MLVLKFWSTVRMREMSVLDRQLVKWSTDGKYGHTLTDLLTQNTLLLLFFTFFKYVTVMIQAASLIIIYLHSRQN